MLSTMTGHGTSMGCRWHLWLSVSAGGSVAIQEAAKGRHPRSVGCMYTIPQRLTVAGEATARSATCRPAAASVLRKPKIWAWAEAVRTVHE